MADAPDGYFLRDVLFFGTSLSPSTIVSRGAVWDLPDLRSADPATHEAYYEGLRVFFRSLNPDQAVQFQWRVDSDYHDGLEAYRKKTEELCGTGHDWCRASRTMRYERANAMMHAGLLRRERLEVYLGRRCSTVPSDGLKTDEQVLSFLDQQAKMLGEQLEGAAGHMPGTRVRVMNNEEHYASYRRFLNPSSHMFGEERYRGFDPHASILAQCVTCDAVTTREEKSVVYKYDGFYHQLLVIKRWPQATHWGMIWNLTGALAGNFVITLNCYPQQMSKVVAREEKDIARLRADMVREKKPSLETIIGNKEAKVKGLTGGFIMPFSALMTIRVFAPTLEELTSQVVAVKNAIGHMDGAQYWQVNQEVQARNLFFETFPGWLGGNYRAWDLYAETSFLPDLVPMSSSFTGNMEEGEALYDGNQGGNLVGVREFANGTPQHAVLLGMTRAGKSSTVIDLLSQTDCFYSFTAIIEEGLSYGTLTKLLGSEPIILHPDGDITLNYFDTMGMPLSQVQIAAAAAQLLVMAGQSGDPEVNARRKAMLAQYVDQLFEDCYCDWRNNNPDKDFLVARMGLAMTKLRTGSGSNGSFGLVERYSELRALKARSLDEYEDLLARPSDDEVLAYSKNSATASEVRNLAFAQFAHADFPTHSALVEQLMHGQMRHHKKDEVDHLASMLGSWVRTGPYGKLFDGPSNRRLDGRVAHFELGFLPRSAAAMKEAAVFAVANSIRQHIVTLPRGQRKRVIFEEPARYINVPGAEEMVAEFYAQLGKFGCRVMPVTQQYGQLSKSALRPVIFGNSKQILLMKQQDRKDLDEIGDAVGLPLAARHMIRNFVLPEHQRGNNRYTDVAIFGLEQEGASCGAVRNYAPPELLYVAESAGDKFDQRDKALAKYPNLIDGVFQEVELAERAARLPRENPLKRS